MPMQSVTGRHLKLLEDAFDDFGYLAAADDANAIHRVYRGFILGASLLHESKGRPELFAERSAYLSVIFGESNMLGHNGSPGKPLINDNNGRATGAH